MQEEMRSHIRTFELVVSIDGVLDVPMSDWPANVTDRVDEALEDLSAKLELPVAIVSGEYKVDPDIAVGAPGRHYLHVIASEVIAADERDISPERLKAEMPDDIKRLLN